MSTSACGCEAQPVPFAPDQQTPWWRNRFLMVPAISGVTLILGLTAEWFIGGADTIAQIFFWLSLILGASQFVPGALRKLFAQRRLTISLLMTISAFGAIALDFIEEAAALAFLFSLVEALEDLAMDKARSGLRSLLALIPKTATVVSADGQSAVVRVEDIEPGDVLRLSGGERLATDGIVRTGQTSLDVSAITGESIPVAVGPGVAVLAGSINTSGVLEVQATAPGTDNSLTTVVELVEQAQAEKGDRARIADRVARPLVPGVLILSLLVAVVGSLLGDSSLWIERALVVLVGGSPCALAISVPITVISSIGAASRFGVTIKSGAAFERLATIQHLAFDKTGTLTQNKPTVSEVATMPGVNRTEVLQWAAAIEAHSNHPLAGALVASTTDPPEATQVVESAGQGIAGVVQGLRVTVGNPRWLDPGPLAERTADMEHRGMTVVIVMRDDDLVGAIGVRDELRAEAAEVVSTLKDAGFGVSMLTGDNQRTAAALAREAGIIDVHAQLTPEDKATAVAALRESSGRPVAMLGDGINDAPALASADIGVAMGATGSDAAVEAADIAFTGDDLRLIPRALRHVRKGRRIIDQNIMLSLASIIILMPLAITGTVGLAGIVLIHETAEVVIILNGLRAARSDALSSTDRSHRSYAVVSDRDTARIG